MPSHTIDADARRAAIAARRANWTPTTAVRIPVSDLRVGDFLVTIHGNADIRGCKVDSTVTATVPDWNTWKLGRHWVRSTIITVAADVLDLNVPDTLTATVRRPAQ